MITAKGTKARIEAIGRDDSLAMTQELLAVIGSEMKANLTGDAGSDYIHAYVNRIYDDTTIACARPRAKGQDELVEGKSSDAYHANYRADEETIRRNVRQAFRVS